MRFVDLCKRCIALIVFLLLCFVSIPLMAQPNVYMTPDNQKVSVGQAFDIVVSIEDIQSSPPENTMRGASVRVDFDPEILQVVSITEGPFMRSFGSTLGFPSHDNTAGWAQFDNSILGSSIMASGAGDLFTIHFEAVGNGTSHLNYSIIDLRNPDNAPLSYTSQNGVVYSGDAILSIEPMESSILIGEECTVYVKVENAVDLKGARSSLVYDSTILEVVSCTAGPFLKGGGSNSTTVFTQIETGTVVCDETILSPPDFGETGAGYLVEIVFRGLAEGLGVLSYDTEDTRLRDPQNQPLAHTTNTGVINVGDPVAVKLTSFTATPQEAGVELCWSTATEANVAGFNLYKSAHETAGYDRVNTSLIEAKGQITIGYDYTYLDQTAPSGILYYKLEEIDLEGRSTFFPVIRVENTMSFVKETACNSYEFILIKNYPNPFNPTTMISYDVPKQSLVKLMILDAQGHIVKVLCNDYQASGHNQVLWNGTNDKNERVASGVYFSFLTIGDKTVHGKMLLVK